MRRSSCLRARQREVDFELVSTSLLAAKATGKADRQPEHFAVPSKPNLNTCFPRRGIGRRRMPALGACYEAAASNRFRLGWTSERSVARQEQQQQRSQFYGAVTESETCDANELNGEDEHSTQPARQHSPGRTTIELLHREEIATLPLQDAASYANSNSDTDLQAKTFTWHKLENVKFRRDLPTRPSRIDETGKFRYLVGLLCLLAHCFAMYSNYTIYTSAIEMVSNNVVSAGLSEIFAKQIVQANPFSSIGDGKLNIAAPGTCPINLLSAPHQVAAAQSNLSSTSQAIGQQIASLLLLESANLISSVDNQIESGKLVNWTISEASLMFSAHNLGGMAFGIPFGRLALSFGYKKLMVVCTAGLAIRMCAFPYVAGNSPFWLSYAFEFFLGALSFGPQIVAHPLAAIWLLPEEANFVVGLITIFGAISTALASLITTQMMSNSLGWASCYYFAGALLGIISVFWMIFGADGPKQSRFVSPAEVDLLENFSLSQQNKQKLAAQTEATSLIDQRSKCSCPPHQVATCPARKLKRKPDWAAVFTCPTVYALLLSDIAYAWNSRNASLWPTFLTQIVHLDTPTIGLITSLRGLFVIIFGLPISYLTRKFVTRRPFNLSLTAYRRLNSLAGALILTLSTLLICLFDCELFAISLSILLVPLVTAFNAISHEQMSLDIAGEDSGLLASLFRSLCFADVGAAVAAGYVLSFGATNSGDRFTWQLVWLIGMFLKLFACFVFVLVAKSEPRSFSRLEPSGKCKSTQLPQ